MRELTKHEREFLFQFCWKVYNNGSPDLSKTKYKDHFYTLSCLAQITGVQAEFFENKLYKDSCPEATDPWENIEDLTTLVQDLRHKKASEKT